MFHVLAFGAEALDASAGDVQLVAIADQVFSRANNNFQMREDMELLWAFGGGTGLTRARFQIASLRNEGFPQIHPLTTAIQPTDNVAMADWRDFPIRIPKLEELRCDVTNGAANDVNVFLGIGPPRQDRNINGNKLRWVRFTASPTGINDGWAAPAAITFQENLSAGTYQVYGMNVAGTALNAGRVVFPDQLFRPGTLGTASAISRINPMFWGGLGLWGKFNTYALPQIEVFTSAAGAVTVTGNMLISKE